MCQIGVVTTQSTLEETPLFSKINTASQMITLINATVDWSVTPRFGTFTSRPPCKGNISALELAIVTSKVSF